jgi:hypothetical protein
MMDLLTRIVIGLNAAANVAGAWLLAPIGFLPGWLSATLVAAVTGVLLLLAFKHTSNQSAIRRVRNGIKADLLALKLFKDSARVAVQAQGRVLWGAVRLLVLAVVPVVVMLVPVSLLLEQLALWYQARPLQTGEEAVLTVSLKEQAAAQQPEVYLEPTSAVEVVAGPVHVRSKRAVCWNLKAREPGYHRLVFRVDGQPVEKELAVGDRFMRVSNRRPGWSWTDALSHPAEAPQAATSPVQAIDIEYPERESWTSGSDWWVGYWFAVSMVAAFCFRGVLKVNI